MGVERSADESHHPARWLVVELSCFSPWPFQLEQMGLRIEPIAMRARSLLYNRSSAGQPNFAAAPSEAPCPSITKVKLCCCSRPISCAAWPLARERITKPCSNLLDGAV